MTPSLILLHSARRNQSVDLERLRQPLQRMHAHRPDHRRIEPVIDDRMRHASWLQELPKPMTKLTWDNAVLVGPKMAERTQLDSKDVVELELNGKKVQAQSGFKPDILTTPSPSL